jgi:hypothetical protein
VEKEEIDLNAVLKHLLNEVRRSRIRRRPFFPIVLRASSARFHSRRGVGHLHGNHAVEGAGLGVVLIGHQAQLVLLVCGAGTGLARRHGSRKREVSLSAALARGLVSNAVMGA